MQCSLWANCASHRPRSLYFLLSVEYINNININNNIDIEISGMLESMLWNSSNSSCYTWLKAHHVPPSTYVGGWTTWRCLRCLPGILTKNDQCYQLHWFHFNNNRVFFRLLNWHYYQIIQIIRWLIRIVILCALFYFFIISKNRENEVFLP